MATALLAGERDDATLAIAAAAGDRSAFAAIYDRYADRLHDFCIGMLRDRDAAADCVQDVFVTAATKLSQLREADRLRPWLYAIARSEALARIRARRREQPSEELPEMASAEPELATLAARCELADLINDACGGLSDRDRTVLELAYRQDLSGPELADALGVTNKNANNLVERLRDTIARSLGALVVSRQVKLDPAQCPELAEILEQSDGEFTVLMRKRIARHIDGCSVCEEVRSRMVNPAMLLGAAPVFIPAPAWLRDATLSRAPLSGTAPTGQSWWPPSDFNVDDLADPPTDGGDKPRPTTRTRSRVGVGATLVLVAIAGGALLARHPSAVVVPATSPEPAETTAATTAPPFTPRLATTTPPAPPPPAATTTPDYIPPAVTETTPPEPSAVPRTETPPTSTAPGPSSIGPSPVQPEPQPPVQQEPQPSESQQPDPGSQGPTPDPGSGDGGPKPPTPGVPKINDEPPAHQGPVQCPPNRPCTGNGSAPVIS